MIYIEKISKNIPRRSIEKMSLTDAKLFIYNLTLTKFRFSDYYIAGSDRMDEFEDLLSFFSKEYIVPVENEVFDKHQILSGIKKNKRLAVNIKPNTILTLQRKFEKMFDTFDITIGLKDKRYYMAMYNGLDRYTFIFNDELEIVDAIIYDSSSNKFEDIKRTIMSETIKQRYYYKRKKHGNN